MLRFAELESSGRRFGPVRTLLRDASNVRRTYHTWGVSAASDAAGRVTVAWQRTGPLGWQLEVVTRPRGGRFAAPVVVAASRRRLKSLQVRAEAPGQAAIIWTAREPGQIAGYCGGVFDAQAYSACEGVWSSLRRGGDWLPGRRLATSDGLNVPLVNAGPDGTFATVLTGAEGLELFRAAPRAHFSDPVRLASGKCVWGSGVDLTPDGHAVVAWREDEDPAVAAAPRRLDQAATVSPDGGVSALWSTAFVDVADGPVVRLNSRGEGVLAWHLNDRGRSGVFALRRRPDGSLDRTQRVFASRGVPFAVPPLAAIAADNTAAVAWTHFCVGTGVGGTLVAVRPAGSARFQPPRLLGTPPESRLVRAPAVLNGRAVVLLVVGGNPDSGEGNSQLRYGTSAGNARSAPRPTAICPS